MCWMMVHVSLLITACKTGEDGKTPWSRARGRGFGQRLYSFGESVLWKPPSKGPQHDPQGNLGPRMYTGTFIGFHRTSNSYRVITEDGDAVKTRGILRRPLADRWNADVLQGITVTPWSLRVAKEPQRVDMGKEVESTRSPRKINPSPED